MEASSTSEMSVNFYQTTWRNKPEDSHLQIIHCDASFHEMERYIVIYLRAARWDEHVAHSEL
jgi:hypothetical protein